MGEPSLAPEAALSRAPRRHGIAWRVALVAISSAAFGGLVAATLAIVAVDQLILEHVDQRLRAATVTLAGELDEEREERLEAARNGSDQDVPFEASVAETLDDENQEISSSGIHLAVFAEGRVLAGDASLPGVAPGRCETRGWLGARLRSCAEQYQGWVLVAAQPSDAARLRWLYFLAALAAVGFGAGGGALLSLGVTRWAIGPLSALTNAIARSRPEGDTALDLGPPSDCEEVEAIRTQLRRLIERTRALLAQAQRFAADAAHELRTPLTALRVELELHAEESSGESRRVLERACARVERLSELSERLLVLALPMDNLQQGFEAVSLAEVVEDVALDLPEAERQRVRLELENEGLVRGDAELLGSLVMNLLQNALKFAPEGAVTLRLIAEPAGSERRVRLSVRDLGPGIPSALRGRVFEAFYRAVPDATPGHGIGLALVGHIVRAHGGSVELLTVAQGACLSVTLPAWSAAAG